MVGKRSPRRGIEAGTRCVLMAMSCTAQCTGEFVMPIGASR